MPTLLDLFLEVLYFVFISVNFILDFGFEHIVGLLLSDDFRLLLFNCFFVGFNLCIFDLELVFNFSDFCLFLLDKTVIKGIECVCRGFRDCGNRGSNLQA